jgi:hypothetical protein
MNNVQEKLKEIGVSITDEKTGGYRGLEEVMIDIAKAFKDLRNKNKTEVNKNIIKERENLIDDICLSLANGEKDKGTVKSLLFKL